MSHIKWMRRFLRGLWITCVLFIVGGITAVAQQDGESGGASDVPNCIQWRAYARYSGLGYSHIVSIHNTCESRAECGVSTNVNPQVQTVSLAAGENAEVITFAGSPASEFVAKVNCRVQSPPATKRPRR